MKESRGYSFTLQMSVSKSPSLGRAVPQLLPDSVPPWRRESPLPWPGPPSFPGCNNHHCFCLTSTCSMIILYQIPAPSLGAADQQQNIQTRYREREAPGGQSHAVSQQQDEHFSTCLSHLCPLTSPLAVGKSCCLSFSHRQLRLHQVAASTTDNCASQFWRLGPNIKMLASCLPVEASLPGLPRAAFSPCPHVVERRSSFSCLSLQGHQAHHEVSILTT